MTQDPLLTRSIAQDQQALADIHDQFYPLVYRYVHYRLEDEQVVEDIASEAFLRLLDTLQRRPAGIANLRAWLLGTAAHLIQDHLRQKYRQRLEHLNGHEDWPVELSTEIVAEETLRRKQVRQALQKLTPEQQHVLALRFSQELSLEETANILNKSVSAVKVLQFRAVASLRRMLEEHNG